MDTFWIPSISVRGTVTRRKWNIQQMGIQIKCRYIPRTTPKPRKECGTNIGTDNGSVSPQFKVNFDTRLHTVKQDKFDIKCQYKAGFLTNLNNIVYREAIVLQREQ